MAGQKASREDNSCVCAMGAPWLRGTKSPDPWSPWMAGGTPFHAPFIARHKRSGTLCLLIRGYVLERYGCSIFALSLLLFFNPFQSSEKPVKTVFASYFWYLWGSLFFIHFSSERVLCYHTMRFSTSSDDL